VGSEENANAFLKITEETVRLLEKEVWLDTAVFASDLLITHNHDHSQILDCPDCFHRLEEAVQLYRGDFLEDLLLTDLAGFQEWVFFHRERQFRFLLDALHSLSKIYFKRTDYENAYKYAWRYVSLVPLEEAAHRMLMRIFALTGRRSAAMQQFQLCKSLLERELRIEPSVETQRLNELISAGISLDKLDTGNLFDTTSPTRPSRTRNRLTGPLYDAFTNLPTRTLYMDRLQHAITRMDRDQTKLAACVLAVSFPLQQKSMQPDLKRQVEQHLVSRLLGAVRKGDTVARLQDDEFALIMEGIKDASAVETISQKIQGSVGTPILALGQRVVVKLVMGASVYPDDGDDPRTLLNKADAAMRTARLKQAAFYFPPSD
jgi:diguanylate cyclase (GGDEF)-like protein